MAEQALVDNGFYVRVMPKPSVIAAGCGFCLRFLPDDICNVALFLLERGVNIKEIYRMEEAGGSVLYNRQEPILTIK
jgi:hypothetical protein